MSKEKRGEGIGGVKEERWGSLNLSGREVKTTVVKCDLLIYGIATESVQVH